MLNNNVNLNNSKPHILAPKCEKSREGIVCYAGWQLSEFNEMI